MRAQFKNGRQTLEATHVTVRDCTKGNSPIVVPAGTQVHLLGSRKDVDGTWKVLCFTTGAWQTDFANIRKLEKGE